MLKFRISRDVTIYIKINTQRPIPIVRYSPISQLLQAPIFHYPRYPRNELSESIKDKTAQLKPGRKWSRDRRAQAI